MPPALEWPAFDREVLREPASARLPGGTAIYSLPSETAIAPADLWSVGAAQQRDAFWERVLRDRCAMREALQVANGEAPTPDGVCLPARSIAK